MADINGIHARVAPHCVGVTVFFNPRWVAEITIGTRTIKIFRRSKLRSCRQRVVIIHTLCGAYHIPRRWWIAQCDPAEHKLSFSAAVEWHHDTNHNEHVFWSIKRHWRVKEIIFGDMSIKMEGRIAFSYLDVRRIERQDGTALWRKITPKHKKGDHKI